MSHNLNSLKGGYIGAYIGEYYSFPKYRVYIGIMEKKMETTILGLYRNSTDSLNSLKGGYIGDYYRDY